MSQPLILQHESACGCNMCPAMGVIFVSFQYFCLFISCGVVPKYAL